MVANKGIVNIINLALSYKLVLVIIIDNIGKNKMIFNIKKCLKKFEFNFSIKNFFS